MTKLKRKLNWKAIKHGFVYRCFGCKDETSAGLYIPQKFPNPEFVFCVDCARKME